jgi:hypothetical protein
MDEKLTQREQAGLLGIVDGTNKDDYDQHFYEAMNEIPPLSPEEIDDRVRRAIFRYITKGKGDSSKEGIGGYIMMGFIHGYMVGRKLKRDITRKPKLSKTATGI